MRRLEEEGPSASDEAPIQARLHEVDIQLERLTEAVAAGGELRSLLARMQALESEREQLARSAARVQKQTETIRFDRPRLEREPPARVEDSARPAGSSGPDYQANSGRTAYRPNRASPGRERREVRGPRPSDIGRVADWVNPSTMYGVP